MQGDALSSEPPGKLLLVYIYQKSTGHGFSLPLKNSANSSALHELIITAKNLLFLGNANIKNRKISIRLVFNEEKVTKI